MEIGRLTGRHFFERDGDEQREQDRHDRRNAFFGNKPGNAGFKLMKEVEHPFLSHRCAGNTSFASSFRKESSRYFEASRKPIRKQLVAGPRG
jgi:hypothetical protein